MEHLILPSNVIKRDLKGRGKLEAKRKIAVKRDNGLLRRCECQQMPIMCESRARNEGKVLIHL